MTGGARCLDMMLAFVKLDCIGEAYRLRQHGVHAGDSENSDLFCQRV
jgi:hypothetical protein